MITLGLSILIISCIIVFLCWLVGDEEKPNNEGVMPNHAVFNYLAALMAGPYSYMRALPPPPDMQIQTAQIPRQLSRRLALPSPIVVESQDD